MQPPAEGHQQADSPLLNLPPELLRLIWQHLRPFSHDSNQHQHALRMACKALMHATTAMIGSLEIKVQGQPASWEGALQRAESILALFPPACTLSKLRWTYHDVGAHAYEWHTVHLPGLLPAFLLASADRLRMVQDVKLSGHAAIGYGEAASLVSVCPRLSRLHLNHAPLVGPLFAPLARLTSLHIKDAWLPQGGVGVAQSLAHLTNLTCLKVQYALEAYGRPADPVLRLEDVLPFAACLPSLSTLSLQMPRQNRDDLLVLHHFSALTSLTSLELYLGTDPDAAAAAAPNDPLTAADLSSFSSLSLLCSLSLLDSPLDGSAAALLSALPRLTALCALAIEPDRDLSGIPCSWKQLDLVCFPNPSELVKLPMPDHLQLVGHPCGDWWLTPDQDLSTAVANSALHRAAKILAQHMPADIDLHLSFYHPPPPLYARRVVPSLAPLRHRLAYLRLGEHFIVDQHMAAQLVEHVPSLQGLGVFRLGAEWGFGAFVAAMGSGLPRLHSLELLCHPQLLQRTSNQAALLEMAAARGGAGQGLTVQVHDVGEQELPVEAQYNELLKASGHTAVRFSFSSYRPRW